MAEETKLQSETQGERESETAPQPGRRLPPEEVEQVRERVVEALKTVYDPEIPVNIYELGLIYRLEVDETGSVSIEMTLTSPMCPVAGSLPGEVEAKARSAEGATDAQVELVWDPPWSMEKMSEEAKLQLGMF